MVSAEACRNLTKLSAGSEIIIAERKVRCQFPHELHIILINKLRLISQAKALLRRDRVPEYAGQGDGIIFSNETSTSRAKKGGFNE